MHICNEYLQVLGQKDFSYLDTYILPDMAVIPNDLENYLTQINLNSVDALCNELWKNEEQRFHYLGLEHSQR